MRAFTLIEVMIAILLVVAISAATLPAVFGRLGDRAFETARTRVELAAMLCRADAIRSGGLRELVAIESKAGITELFTRQIIDTNENENHDPVEPIRRFLIELPARCTVVAGSDDHAGDDDRAGVFDLPDDVLDEMFADEPALRGDEIITIAVFLPDGSAQPLASCRIVGRGRGGGRTAAISVGALTGSIRTHEFEPAATDEPDRVPELGP